VLTFGHPGEFVVRHGHGAPVGISENRGHW
jgi:hypothetical protein